MEDEPIVSFPIGTLCASAITDIIDIFNLADLGTISFIIMAILIQMPITFYLLYWYKSRGKSAAGKEALKKAVTRNVGVLALDFVPLLEFLPWTTLFVYMTYRAEKKGSQNAQYEKSGITREKRGAISQEKGAGIVRSKRG